ncbi:MAG: hypothetical protein SFV15_18415 [Polyangiaceae bacterium]|nr:hypothetical protein [Polyangiaceae bacterium]
MRVVFLIASILVASPTLEACGGGSSGQAVASGGAPTIGGAETGGTSPRPGAGGGLAVGGAVGELGGISSGSGGAAMGGSDGGTAGQPPSLSDACVDYCRVSSSVGCANGPTAGSCDTATCDGFPKAAVCKSQYYRLFECFSALGPSAFECTADGRPTGKGDQCSAQSGNLRTCLGL